MKRTVILSLWLALGACSDNATEPQVLSPEGPSLSVVGADPSVGAIVLNQGQASEPVTGTCTFLGRLTTDVVLVRNASGGGLLRCQWDVWPTTSVFDRAQRGSGFNCFLNFFGSSVTDRSSFVLATSGTANMSCTFKSIPTAPTAQCYGQITSGIASTWPWAHDGQSAFPPPPGGLAKWIEDFGPIVGVSNVRDLQILFCDT